MKIINLIYLLIPLSILNSVPVQAGEYKLIKEDKKTGYSIADTSGVCQAYEKNLNKFRHIPYGMACERSLDPNSGFTRPIWKPLDPFKYSDLIREIFQTRKTKQAELEDPNKWKQYVENEAKQGKLILEMARINTGNRERVVTFLRIRTNKKCSGEKTYNSAFTSGARDIYRVNNDLTHLTKHPFLGFGKGNLIVYKNRIFTDRYYGDAPVTKNIIGHDATLELDEVEPNRVGLLCIYYYYDGSVQ
ncbi:MAG: hypothetical protein ACWGOV_04125 [Acidiferrobacterales bacterium]